MELFREIVRNEFPILRYDLIHSKMHKLSLILVSKEIKHRCTRGTNEIK